MSVLVKENQQVLDDIELLFSKGLFWSIIQNEDPVRHEIFSTLASRADVDYLFVMSLEGQVDIAHDLSLFHINPATTGHMTQENVNQILKGSSNDDGCQWCIYCD